MRIMWANVTDCSAFHWLAHPRPVYVFHLAPFPKHATQLSHVRRSCMECCREHGSWIIRLQLPSRLILAPRTQNRIIAHPRWLSTEARSLIQGAVDGSPVVLFMKGACEYSTAVFCSHFSALFVRYTCCSPVRVFACSDPSLGNARCSRWETTDF